jgi:hypothetical protein
MVKSAGNCSDAEVAATLDEEGGSLSLFSCHQARADHINPFSV